jgi:hypothetical protein
MQLQLLLDHYVNEVEVEYEGETYLVRDNGAVCRKSRQGRHRRSLDEVWAFGREGKHDRYMSVGSRKVHRIVAFAFLGSPPSGKHVVDHIDRDRTNNRVENLRWLSPLENLIRHPGFRKRIISAYGSLEDFFEHPSEPMNPDSSIDWLRSITKEDVERARKQLSEWTGSDGFKKGGVLSNRVHGNLQPLPPARPPISEPDVQSLTPSAVQRRWKTPAEFPNCPSALGQNPLGEYAANLRPDAVFARDRYKESFVVMAEQGNSLLSVLVKSGEEHAVKPWAVSKVAIENAKFVHESRGTYFDLIGAKKEYYGLLGIPFQGESIDDYC